MIRRCSQSTMCIDYVCQYMERKKKSKCALHIPIFNEDEQNNERITKQRTEQMNDMRLHTKHNHNIYWIIEIYGLLVTLLCVLVNFLKNEEKKKK